MGWQIELLTLVTVIVGLSFGALELSPLTIALD
jgi:hypothetical protein